MSTKIDYTQVPQAFIDAVQRLVEVAMQGEEAQKRMGTYLLERGWFFTSTFPYQFFTGIEKRWQAGDHDGVDEVMVAFTKGQLDKVEATLVERFPTRAKILADAFEAHRAGKYSLSVPVFLTQADGIGCEVLPGLEQFFPKSSREKAFDQRLGGFALYNPCEVMWEILGLAKDEMSIAVRTKKRDERRQTDHWYGPLNRNGVLHGYDTDYATEANSSRCVLLLQWLLDLGHTFEVQIPKDIAFLQTMSVEGFEEPA